MTSRNRAVHGDLVVIELLPRSEWKGRSNVIKDTSEHLGKLKKKVFKCSSPSILVAGRFFFQFVTSDL